MNGLKYIRTLYKMSLQEVADKVGVTKSIVSKWERNERTISRDNLVKLCETFKIPSFYFPEDLTEVEMLTVKKLKLNNDVEHSIREAKRLDGTVEKIEVKTTSKQLMYEMNVNNFLFKKAHLVNSISEFLLPPDEAEDEEEMTEYILSNYGNLLENINAYTFFTELLVSRKIPSPVLMAFLMVLNYKYEVDSPTRYVYDKKTLDIVFKAIMKEPYDCK